MKILHTADWHIGQLFHAYDRTFEHQQFLNWLVETVVEQQADVLLISDDIFDVANPSAASVKMFYSFLNSVTLKNPALQVVITAGNHDSAARMEAPKPLLESTNIHIVGVVDRTENGEIDYDKLIVPLHNASGEVTMLCLAVPFLRMGDYPVIPESVNSYAAGVAALYDSLYRHAVSKMKPGQTIIAMGHLHAQQVEPTDMDTTERLIMGGVERIETNAFPKGISYVALGHIHKAQSLNIEGTIRYSGSPLPMSFAERDYVHEVVSISFNNGHINNIEHIPIPITVPLIRIPEKPEPLSQVLAELQQLPAATNSDMTRAPYLEVNVLLDGPEPALRHKVEALLKHKYIRLAKIDSKYPRKDKDDVRNQQATMDRLTELKPADLFGKLYFTKYNADVPEHLMRLFNQVVQEVNTKDI